MPITTTGDGNCLFNAISIAVIGNESLSAEVRVCIFVELAENKQFYINAHKNDDFWKVADYIEDAITSCATNKAYSCAWTMHGAASVIGRTVRSVFLAHNCQLDPAICILNTEFHPRKRTNDGESEIVRIMWPGSRNQIGHFVPLMEKDEGPIIDLTSPSIPPPPPPPPRVIALN